MKISSKNDFRSFRATLEAIKAADPAAKIGYVTQFNPSYEGGGGDYVYCTQTFETSLTFEQVEALIKHRSDVHVAAFGRGCGDGVMLHDDPEKETTTK